MKPVILFASAVCPGQFSLLCQYLNDSGMADAYYLTMPGNKARNDHRYTNLLPFDPDGDINKPHYYYAARTERSARISRGLLAAVRKFIAEKGRPDLIMCHSNWAPPQFLFDELDIPIISYIEFPSYHAHGWDSAYPPDAGQRLTDRNSEMVAFHQVLRSALTIVPSAYAKSLFPAALQSRIAAQYEGFDVKPEPAPARAGGPFTLGFAARDLSNAKGLEVFVRLVDRLVQEGDGSDMRFVAIGDPAAPTYGYEQQFVHRHYDDKTKTYRDYLMERFPAASVIEFPGKLPYDDYAALVNRIDLFLYPLRYGVANWGIMEIMARGRPVIASHRNFLPELITHGVNGLLLPDDDDLWLREIRRLRDLPSERAALAAGAAQTGAEYHISKIAPKFMALFRQAMAAGNPPRFG